MHSLWHFGLNLAINLLDISIVWYIFYRVLLIIRHTRAVQIMMGIVILLVGFTDQRPDERKKLVEAVSAAVKAGKTHPDTKKNLMLLIEEDKAKLETFLKNIQDAAQKKMNQAGFKHPDPEEAANG